MKMKMKGWIGMVVLKHTGHAQQPTPQTVDITKGWKIFVGDDRAFAQPTCDDKNWKPVSVLTEWEK
ncbi:hypothetical protein BH10BAC3_BH10BAC3_28160 [soil metagenome]